MMAFTGHPFENIPEAHYTRLARHVSNLIDWFGMTTGRRKQWQ